MLTIVYAMQDNLLWVCSGYERNRWPSCQCGHLVTLASPVRTVPSPESDQPYIDTHNITKIARYSEIAILGMQYVIYVQYISNDCLQYMEQKDIISIFYVWLYMYTTSI